MNLIKTANGKQALKLTKADWIGIGKQAGWLTKEAIWPFKSKSHPVAEPTETAPAPVANRSCPACDGVNKQQCQYCKGAGTVTEEERTRIQTLIERANFTRSRQEGFENSYKKEQDAKPRGSTYNVGIVPDQF